MTCTDGQLHCTCCFRKRYGIDCSHVYNVAASFQGYQEPSHHEVDLRWWSSYSLYGLSFNSSNTHNEKVLLRTYDTLRESQYTGLPIYMYSDNKIPIVPSSGIPEHFKEQNFPICLNFPNLKVFPQVLLKGEHDIAGLSQLMSSYPDQEINNIFEEVIENNYERENQGNVTANPYAELIPYFVEMTSHMEGYCSIEDFGPIRKYFEKKTAEFKGRAKLELDKKSNKLRRSTRKKRELVSSTISSNKKKKPHGTKYARRSS